MSFITLAGPQIQREPEKLCGGDIYRAHAPKPADEPDNDTLKFGRNRFQTDREGYIFKNKKKVRQRDYIRRTNPRKTVIWEEASEEMVVALYMQMSKSRVATELNKKFPQGNGILFTKDAVAGKYFRLTYSKK